MKAKKSPNITSSQFNHLMTRTLRINDSTSYQIKIHDGLGHFTLYKECNTLEQYDNEMKKLLNQ